MDILSYLSELLQSRKSVGISGLGTVYKKKVPGRYNAETHSFFPPSFVLDFKTEVLDDSALAEYICSQKNVSEDTALFVIEEFSNGIHKQLNAGEEVYLGDLGKLLKDGQQIQFTPAEKSSMEGNEFFGLPAVEESPEILQEPKVVNTTEDEKSAQEQTPPEINDREQLQVKTDDQPANHDHETQDTAATEIYPELGSVEESRENTTASDLNHVHPLDQPVIETAEDLVEDDEDLPVSGNDPTALISTPVPPMENPVGLDEPTDQAENATVPASVKDQSSAQQPVEEKDQPIVRKSINDTFKTEEQLRSEIEALNYYRSKSPSKPVIEHDDEILWKLKTEKESSTNPEEPEVTSFYQSEDEVVKGTPWLLKVIYGLLILVIVAGVLYVIQPSLFNRLTGNKPGMSHPSDPVDQSVSAIVPTDSTAQDSIIKANPAGNRDSVVNTAKPPVVAADTATVYEVIGASMHNQKEADAFIALMKKSGIEAKVVTNMAGRRLKMSIGTFKDEVTAKEELEKLSKRLKIPGIYIYKNKQK